MDTLKSTRHGERVIEVTMEVLSNLDVSEVCAELGSRERREDVLVFRNDSDEVADKVLSVIDPEESGYVFFGSELDIDPLNNCMVPKHRIATKKEIDDLLDRKVPLEKLPVLHMLDIIRRWHNFPRGSIVAIERSSTDVYFRRVV
jgi:DNA-directed RNA polymerase subunit H (RpoH/RPB5)